MIDDRIPPTPWSLDIHQGVDGESLWGIRDANGHEIVVTDCGYYPPNKATAQLIIDAVNMYMLTRMPRP